MSKILATFSGKFGDILWSLPTVREISKREGTPVDMGIMPAYKSLLPLLQMQPYICRAFTIDDWVCTGSPCGDQPWQPPVRIEEHYEKSFHLTYRRHPQSNEALIDFTAQQQGLVLTEPVVPFISTTEAPDVNRVAYAFNPMYKDLKDKFIDNIRFELSELRFADVTGVDWVYATQLIKHSTCFIGCRSSNFVLAHGVGQPNIFIYDPHPARNAMGHFGYTFGNPHWKDVNAHIQQTPEESANQAINFIKQCVKEKENEHAIVKA